MRTWIEHGVSAESFQILALNVLRGIGLVQFFHKAFNVTKYITCAKSEVFEAELNAL